MLGIESMLQVLKQRKLEYLRKFKPILHSIVETPETFYSMRMLELNGKPENINY